MLLAVVRVRALSVLLLQYPDHLTDKTRGTITNRGLPTRIGKGRSFTSACLEVLDSAPDSTFESEAAAPSPAVSSARSATVSAAAAAAVLAEGAAQKSRA